MITEMSFPTRIVFGTGALSRAGTLLRELGVRRPLLVADPGVVAAGLVARLTEVLDLAKLPFSLFADVAPNPTGANVEAGAAAYRRAGCDGVVAIGGGSPLDAAKGVRLLATHPPPLARYDDAADGWRHVQGPLPPMVAIPTTAGTGSEVGRSFVVTLPETGRKTVIFAPALLPTVAVCDPELTYDLPPRITATTGMDALTHNLEALCAKGFHPLADALAHKGLALCGRSLVRAVQDGRDGAARADMMIAAITGAAAFQKGLGASHALAHALGPVSGVHHGLANAIVLPHVMRWNLEAARPQLAEAAVALGEASGADEAALAARAVERVDGIARAIGIPARLRDAGVEEGQLERLADKAFEDASHLANPRPCTRDDLARLLRAAF